MEQSDIDLLYTVPPYHLQALAKLLRPRGQSSNIPPPSASTSVPEIVEHLFHPSTINEAIRSLNDTERLILYELVFCGGRANSRDLALYLVSSGALGSAKESEPSSTVEQSKMLYPTPHPHGLFEQSLRRLLMLGLLFWGKQTNFAGRDYTSGVYDGVLIVPQVVKDAVNEIASREKSIQEEQPLASYKGIGEGLRTLQRTLYLYWSHVAALREGLPLVNSGLLSRSALRQIMELWGSEGQIEQIRTEQDVPRLLFIRLLLMQLGLLQERQGAVHAADAEKFFSLSVLERARRCYRLWLETPFWNELGHLREVVVRPGPAPLDPAHEEVVRARQMLMNRVLAEQPGTWYELTAFIARTKLYTPYLLFPRQYGPRAERYSLGSNPYGWDFRLRRGWLTHREGWHLVEGGFIRTVVSGPLHWLGLVDVKDGSSEANATAFRLTDGINLVTSDSLPEIEDIPRGRLIVQPNFEMVALAPVSEALLIKLDRFADRLSLEHIAQYRITKASVTRAIQMGLHADAIQQILEEASGREEIPQNVRYSLVEWERQARRIELWQGATLLEVDDSALLDDLFAGEETGQMLGRRLSPTLAEVATHQLSPLQEILWRRDYLPALVSAPVQDSLLEQGRLGVRESQWKLHEDGLLEPLYAVTDLYLAAEIEHVSEPDGVTGWRKITPPIIQRACRSGLSLDVLIRFLQQYCEGGVPGSFLIRLKLWGGGYGDRPGIQVEQAPLLYLPAEVLQDIQADEELHLLLGAEVEQQGRLVRIPPRNLERVVELLRDRGFEVK
jgi:XPB/Ssl2-like helicase family protein